MLWSPLDFLTFENLFSLDSRDDGFLRFWDVIFLDVEDNSNLSSRINTKTFLILFKLPFCLLYKLYSLKYIFLLGWIPVTCWVKIWMSTIMKLFYPYYFAVCFVPLFIAILVYICCGYLYIHIYGILLLVRHCLLIYRLCLYALARNSFTSITSIVCFG